MQQFFEVMEGEGLRMEDARFRKKGDKREAVLKFSLPAGSGFGDLPREMNKALAIMQSREDGQLRADFSLKLEKRRLELYALPEQPNAALLPAYVVTLADLTGFRLARAPFEGTLVRLYFRAKAAFDKDEALAAWAGNAVGNNWWWRMTEVQGDLFPENGGGEKGASQEAQPTEAPAKKRRGRKPKEATA